MHLGRGNNKSADDRYLHRLRVLWIAPVLLAIWANTHGGFLAGAAIYVGHFGCKDHSRRTIEQLIARTGDLKVRLTTENMKGTLGPYAEFVEAIDSPRLGLTLDIGHASDADGRNPFTVPDRAREAVAEAGPCLAHAHLVYAGRTFASVRGEYAQAQLGGHHWGETVTTEAVVVLCLRCEVMPLTIGEASQLVRFA